MKESGSSPLISKETSDWKDTRFRTKATLMIPDSHFIGKNIWILKATGLNRGKGIHVVDNLKDVKRIIKQECSDKDNRDSKQTNGLLGSSNQIGSVIGTSVNGVNGSHLSILGSHSNKK